MNVAIPALLFVVALFSFIYWVEAIADNGCSLSKAIIPLVIALTCAVLIVPSHNYLGAKHAEYISNNIAETGYPVYVYGQ